MIILRIAFIMLMSISTLKIKADPGEQIPIYLSKNASPFGYWEYLPKNFNAKKDFPLVIFLHGLGEKGDGNKNLGKVLKHGPPKKIKNGYHFPAIVLSPQSSTWWKSNEIDKFLNYAMSKYPVDKSRIYITGLSMGGGGTWMYARDYHNKLAAILPVCGAAKASKPENLVKLPIWAFHNKNDKVVSVNNTYGWINGIKKAGGNPLMTIYPENGHDAWSKTYDDEKVWDWLFKQKLNKNVNIKAPSQLTVKNESVDYLDFSWKDNSDNEEGFILEIKKENEKEYSKIKIPKNKTAYRIKNLDCNSNYQARIKAINSLNDSGFSNEVMASTPGINPPSIEITGKTEFCKGEQTKLEVKGEFQSYLWNSGEKTSRITVENPGTFKIKIKGNNNCWSNFSKPVKIIVNKIPEPPVIKPEGKTTICLNEKLTLATNQKYEQYEWSNGLKTEKIDVNKAGNFSVKVANENCWSQPSKEIEINTFDSPPQATIQYSGKNNFCEGEELQIKSAKEYNFYQWSTGETTRNIIVNSSKSLNLKVAHCKNQWSTASKTINFKFSKKPEQPKMNLKGNIKKCKGEIITLNAPDGFKAYEWKGINSREASVKIDKPGQYSVRILSKNNCWSNFSEITQFNFLEKTSKPLLNVKNTYDLCSGESIEIKPEKKYVDYLWSNSSKEKSIIVKQSVELSLKVRNQDKCWSEASETVKIILRKKPDVPKITSEGNGGFCEGDLIILSGPAGYKNYFWSTNANTQKIKVSEGGNYYLKVRNSYCWSDFSAEFPVGLIKTPGQPTITEQGIANLCDGEELAISVKEDYKFYKWSNGEKQKSITVAQSGNYSVQVGNCSEEKGWSTPSEAIEVNVVESPPETYVLINGDSLHVPSNSSHVYQWYLNELAIIGANQNFLIPSTDGEYKVEIKNEFGCAIFSNLYQYITKNENLIIYPNPNNGIFKVKLKDPQLDSGKITVSNLDNRIVKEYYYTELINQTIPIHFDLSELKPGLFLIKIESGNQLLNEKLIVR